MQRQMGGATLPTYTRVFRFEVVETLLMAGIPISKIDVLRPLSEKYGHSFTASTQMKNIIPAVLAREQEKSRPRFRKLRKRRLYLMDCPTWQGTCYCSALCPEAGSDKYL